MDCGLSEEQLQAVEQHTELADGAAAMTAYARLQFEDVSERERQTTEAALLRYCELDTLAMVMIWEGWREMVR